MFRYNDKVRIVDGFYQNLRGIIKKKREGRPEIFYGQVYEQPTFYSLKLECDGTEIEIEEACLELATNT